MSHPKPAKTARDMSTKQYYELCHHRGRQARAALSSFAVGRARYRSCPCRPLVLGHPTADTIRRQVHHVSLPNNFHLVQLRVHDCCKRLDVTVAVCPSYTPVDPFRATLVVPPSHSLMRRPQCVRTVVLLRLSILGAMFPHPSTCSRRKQESTPLLSARPRVKQQNVP